MVRVTKEWLESGMKGGVGIKSKQCKILGIPYPPPKGWKKIVIGKYISETDAENFLILKDKKKIKHTRVTEIQQIPSEKKITKPNNSNNTIVLTENMVKNGFGKKQLSKGQCMLLGIPTAHNKKYIKDLVGKEIDRDTYKEFRSLKNKMGKKAYINKMQTLYRTILNQNFTYNIPFFELLELVKAEKELKKFITQIPYSEFLNSAYWRSISTFLKDTAGACEICGSTNSLVAHHKTYLHHGDEIHHMSDLTVLCNSCHKKEHKLHPELTFTNRVAMWGLEPNQKVPESISERNIPTEENQYTNDPFERIKNITFDDMRPVSI